MADKLKLTVACGDYEIVRALKERTVEADGLDLVMLTGMGSRERHWRMARKLEFDVCEINVGAYFMARERDTPITALPVFLHRRFRHGFIFWNFVLWEGMGRIIVDFWRENQPFLGLSLGQWFSVVMVVVALWVLAKKHTEDCRNIYRKI